VSVARLRQMLAADSLHEGMRPKVRSIIHALDQGVERAHILDGRVLHAVLLEIFTDEGVGTMVRPNLSEPGGVLMETAHLEDAS